MIQYINKDVVVEEIERRIADNKKDIERASHTELEDYFEGYEDALVLFKKNFLDTLEVKEVDLEKELKHLIGNVGQCDRNLAKHFFELGLKAKRELIMKDIKEIVDNVNSLSNDILDYITSTEHCLFNWISNKEVQNFIKAYPDDYKDMFHLSVSTISASPLIRISFDEHPDDISYIERYAILPTFRDTTKARWMEWNGKVKELQISDKEKELNYYKRKVDETEKEIEELKRK